MFSVTDYIREDLIVTNFKAKNRNESIAKLIDILYRVNPSSAGSVKKEKALKMVIEREDSQSTGVGEALAFPHARIEGWLECAVVIAKNSEDIDFNSIDKKPVRFIVLIISSGDKPYLVLQIMASIIRCIKNNKMLSILKDGITPREIYDEFKSQDSTKLILARDIMRPVKIFVKLDDKVESAVKLMHLNFLDALPVVDENHFYKGVVSCFDIFNYSIPDFFNQLQTVSFVRHLDPFEKYFIVKSGLTVKDILVKDNYIISQEATLMEIIFELSVKNKVKLFVLENDRLAGEIDRFSLIDKVLFF